MTRMVTFKKLTCIMMIFCMLFTYVPNSFAGWYWMQNNACGYYYTLTVKIADSNGSESGGYVYSTIHFNTGGSVSQAIDASKKGSTKSYRMNLNVQPWEISHVEFTNNSDDDVKIESYKLTATVYSGDSFTSTELSVVPEQYIWTTLKKSSAKYNVQSYTQRDITAISDSFGRTYGGTIYLKSGDSGDIEKQWDGMIEDDHACRSYNCYSYPNQPGMTITLDGIDKGILKKNGGYEDIYAESGVVCGYKISKQKLYEQMEMRDVYKLTITTTLSFNKASDKKDADGKDKTYTATCTIIRPEFVLESAKVVTAPYTASIDNNYFNSNYTDSDLEIEIPVKIHKDYDASAIAAKLAAYKEKFKLYYGENEADCIEPESVTSEGRMIKAKYRIPTGYANESDVGMTLKIKEPTFYDGTSYKISDYTETFGGKYKIDTLGVKYTLKDESGAEITGFDAYKQSYKFKLDINETPYINGNPSFFSYKLYKTSEKKEEIPLVSKYSSTSMVPHTNDTVYEIKPKTKIEGDYVLEIKANDVAGNESTLDAAVKLDGIAPRASYTSKVLRAGDTKRFESTFDIEDASQTGKLYYCFVKDGESVPAANPNAPENSGTVGSVIGQWGFINQANPDANTVALVVNSGDVFKGKLYYYTVDGAGNDSRSESGENKNNGFNYINVDVNNTNPECDITVEDLSPALSEYNISLSPKDAADTVAYRWKNSSFVTTEKTYKGENVGSKTQQNGSGQNVTLDGKNILEYTVISSASGNKTTYTKEFLFDNTNPELTVSVKNQRVAPTRGISIYVEDLSKIRTLEYQLVDADKNTIAGCDMVQLPANSTKISTDIVVEPEKTGAYRVFVRAVDSNGYTTEKYSDVFSTRNSAPSVEVSSDLTKRTAAEVYLANTEDSTKYNVLLNVSEDFLCADKAEIKHDVYCRFSDDGINYGDWEIAGTLTGGEGAMSVETGVKCPVVLNSGENRIFIETACLSRGDSPKNISDEFVTKSSELVIVYDTEAPECKFVFDDRKTSGDVYGTLTIKDDYSKIDEITYRAVAGDFEVDSIFVTLDKDNAVVENGELTVPVIINSNGNHKIVVTDSCGNRKEIPFYVGCRDVEPPLVNFDSHSRTGDPCPRKDETLVFNVDGAIEEKTKLALYPYSSDDPNVVVSTPIPGASDDPNGNYVAMNPGDIPDELFETENPAIQILKKEVCNSENEYGETNLEYEVAMRGSAAGSYVPVAYAEDAFGNSRKYVIGPILDLVDAPAEITGYTVRGAENEEAPIYVGEKAIIDVSFNVPVYVLPPDKLPDRGNYATDEEYNAAAKKLAVDMADEDRYREYYDENYKYELIVSGYGTYTLYYSDACGRGYTGTVEVTQDQVTFSSYPVSSQLYKADEDDANMNNWTPIDSIPVFEDGKAYYLVLDGTSNSQQFTVGESSDYSIDFDYDKSVPGDEGLYSKAVYNIYDWGTNNRVLYYRVKTAVEGSVVETGEVYELNITDTTAPVVDVKYSTENDTVNPVNVLMNFYDPEAAVDVEDKEEYTDEELAQMAGIKEVRITDIYDQYPDNVSASEYKKIEKTVITNTIINNETNEIEVTTAKKPVDACTSHSVKFDKNGWIFVKVTNNLGLTTTKEIQVYNISDHITEGTDFNVEYYYLDSNGAEQPITDGASYKSVIARIVPTWAASWYRDLYVANNGGSFERELTDSESSFTFILKDKYGDSLEKTVWYDYFDGKGPDISYEYDRTKTNQAVEVTITAADTAGVSSVKLASKDGSEIDLTSNGGDVYTAGVASNGMYIITATDSCGNTSYKSFTVNCIDTEKPEIYDIVYTTEEPTNQSVGVKLYYTKSGVTIKNVVPVGSTNISDITVDYSSSIIRFKENGTVEVTFADEYGNEGEKEIVTVTNINREAPSLAAVCTLSEDNLSVKVKFELAKDETGVPIDTTGRQLSDINVMYYGNTETADKAEFEFVENGTYTFYAFDSIGNAQIIKVTVSGIDDTAPEITNITVTYKSIDAATGNLIDKRYDWTVGNEAGYNFVDDTHEPTNQNVEVTATTDKDTVFAGSPSSDYSTTHSVEYDENGWFNFYLAGKNKLMSQYGVGIYLIDKIPPVIENVDDLIFYENTNAGTAYDKSMLTSFTAYDMKGTKKVDMTNQVTVDYGTFNPDNIAANRFDRTHPYEITYTVKDKVGNTAEVKRTVTLVGLFDTLMLVNGQFPDSSNRIEVESDSVELALQNFSGKAYARYEKGYYTIGEMKNKGTVIQQNGDKFAVSGLAEGWYTFYVQTDLRDYFCVNVYVMGSK